MKSYLKVLIFLPLVFAFDVANYRNHKAIELQVENESQLQVVKGLEFMPGVSFVEF
jgi:hypothetical protein